MKRLIFIIVAAVLSCGLSVSPETAEQRKQREREEREWAKTAASRYDQGALLAFLKQTIAAKKSWKGVDLTKPAIGASWEMTGHGMASGEWSFSTPDPKKDEFSLTFPYQAETGQHLLSLRCVRDGTRRFRLVDITREEVVALIL